MYDCVFAGTFDPITVGHMDIIERGIALFGHVHVVIMDNAAKRPMFSCEERLRFIEEATAELNVTCAYHDGLMVDYLREVGIKTVIRGVRNSLDFDYERSQENINRHLYEDIEIVYLGACSELMHISSGFVRELMRCGKDVSEYIPFEF